MNYKFLGKTGVKVSAIAYGTMSFGGDADEAGSKALFEACRAAGVNLFDCADMYAAGRAEEILGRLIKDCREEVLITSKAYFATSKDVNAMGASRRHIMYAVEASLRRLQTDRIDIYYVHRFDDRTPLEETLRALDDLVRQGKVVYTGPAISPPGRSPRRSGSRRKRAWPRSPASSPCTTSSSARPSPRSCPWPSPRGSASSPTARSRAACSRGKYGPGRRPETGRLITNKIYATRYADALNYEVAERFTAFAAERGFDPAGLAVAWAASHPAVTAPLIGARNTAQLAPLLAAADIPMTPELRAEISALSPEPAPATDRNEERTGFNFGVR